MDSRSIMCIIFKIDDNKLGKFNTIKEKLCIHVPYRLMNYDEIINN